MKNYPKKKNQVIIAYDMNDNERLIHMCENTQQMSDYFGSCRATIQSAIYYRSLLQRRYLIERAYE